NEVGVLNRQTHALLARWPIIYAKENVPMALDEANHRLFVGTRTPPRIIVLDTDTGRVVTSLPIALHTDDLAFDQIHQRIYAACGQGYISVYHEAGPNRYQLLENVPTAPGGKTGTFVRGTNRYYAAIPKNGQKPAEVRVYNVAP
ncbi:MAG: YncE family protein, partial [Terriglobia bacterium]